MMKKRILPVLLVFLIFIPQACRLKSDPVISLAGNWMVKLDPEGKLNGSQLNDQDLNEIITLPGTTDEAKVGKKTVDTAYGILSREYEYTGPAWYMKKIRIPEDWKDKEILLFLERVLWESRVYVDGEFKDMQDGLGTPHVHRLGTISPGEHKLSIRINNDMVHNIGDKGHAYGEYMQSIWNGVVGRIELRAQNSTHIKNLRLFPDISNRSVDVEMEVSKAVTKDLEYIFRIREKGSRDIVLEETYLSAEPEIRINLKPTRKIQLWNEFNPFTYELEVTVGNPEKLDLKSYSFGFSEVSKTRHHVLVNKEKVFLRGNLDCVHFPETGYPSMDTDEWEKIFRTYKRYGLNHVRFHSWCPPEAAFDAADRVGIYIQAEASVWIDWWMGTDMVARGRPEMDTKGKPQGIGRGDEDADRFIRDEMQRVVDTYGNHPSFILFCIGNELGSSDFDLTGKWIAELKEHDPRRLYAASTARTITPFCDYSATHNVPGIGGVRQRMFNHKNWDYEDRYSRATVPVIAHEIGQWPVYPEWDEIDKYTGVLKPRNLEQLRNIAMETGLLEQDKKLREASGKLSALLYKDEVESFMRTPSCAGFQLLSMQDYIGQGEALIGWLDSFYDPKGTLDPEDARQFLNVVVPLLELPAYVWKGGDTIRAEALLHQYGSKDLIRQKITCSLSDRKGKVLYKEDIPGKDYSRGGLHEIARLAIPLPDIVEAGQYSLELGLEGTNYRNSWPVWIYPREINIDPGDIIISENLDESTIRALEEGGKVLLIADRPGKPENNINAAFKPLYWSASFFPGQSIETLGAFVDNSHPALANFPTENFATWNWWNLCEGAKAFDLTYSNQNISLIVQPVSDFHFSKLLGSIFEAKVGKGKLLVCGYNIAPERDSLPEAKQLRYSLVEYMTSGGFKPVAELGLQELNALFPASSLNDIEKQGNYQGAGFNETGK